ncbi:MAG: cytochrome c-type biogenesis protein CcmH [bacterium]|nr:cytochrome c-type biogenesis protein CcmH [bacterium]
MRLLAAGILAVALHGVLWSVPGAVAQSAKTQIEDPVLATRFNAISDRLVCRCGCNMILRVCNHFECPSAVPMRASIDEQLLTGNDDDTIVQSFVDEYGMVVLSAPPTSGVNLAAWVMPGFAILVGFFLVFYFVSDWLAKRKAKPAARKQAIDPLAAARIEDELKSMEL